MADSIWLVVVGARPPVLVAPGSRRVKALGWAIALAIATLTTRGSAQPSVVPDRVAIRYVTPETGGAAHPRFLTDRELGFFTRVEAMIEHVSIAGDSYPERYVRAATDRLVARAMLASLLVQGGSEPPDLQRRVEAARAELAARMGGDAVLDETLQHEGLEEFELAAFLRDFVRAAWYADKALQPLLRVGEDSLREAYRSTPHPFRAMKYEDARSSLRLWLVAERMRSAELEFLQSARARTKIVTVLVTTPDERARH